MTVNKFYEKENKKRFYFLESAWSRIDKNKPVFF